MSHELELQLEHSMKNLIRVMRLFLDNLHEEHQAVLFSQSGAVRSILRHREILLDEMTVHRQTMTDTMQKIKPEVDFDCLDAEQISLITLRDQILALSERIEQHNFQNNCLISDLHPKSSPAKKVQLLVLEG